MVQNQYQDLYWLRVYCLNSCTKYLNCWTINAYKMHTVMSNWPPVNFKKILRIWKKDCTHCSAYPIYDTKKVNIGVFCLFYWYYVVCLWYIWLTMMHGQFYCLLHIAVFTRKLHAVHEEGKLSIQHNIYISSPFCLCSCLLLHDTMWYSIPIVYLLACRTAQRHFTVVLCKTCIAVGNFVTATGTHVPYGITRCYVPPGKGGITTCAPAG